MKRQPEIRSGQNGLSEAEATLRLIAVLPAPERLEERVKARLQQAPAAGAAHVLDWPAESGSAWTRGAWTRSAWVRGAAAAAIVAVVAGGSWGIYARVQPSQAPIAMPHVGTAAGFSSANAMRTPKTLDTPTVTQPAAQTVTPAAAKAGRPAASSKKEDVQKKAAHSVKPVAAHTNAR